MLAAHLPPLSTLVPPAVPMPAAAIDLRRFAAFAAIGDSTVRQFRPLIQEKRPLNFSYTDASGSMLDRFSPELGSSKVCEEAAERALKAQGGVSHGARQLVLYGSGAWDLVDESKTALTTASEYQAAFTQCLRQIKRRFPGATFVLKAFFMMHPLRVDCERASALCANKMWGASSCGERCYARTKYMSASRSQQQACHLYCDACQTSSQLFVLRTSIFVLSASQQHTCHLYCDFFLNTHSCLCSRCSTRP